MSVPVRVRIKREFYADEDYYNVQLEDRLRRRPDDANEGAVFRSIDKAGRVKSKRLCATSTKRRTAAMSLVLQYRSS